MKRKRRKIISIILFALACCCFIGCVIWDCVMLSGFYENKAATGEGNTDRLSLQLEMGLQTVFVSAGFVFAVISFVMKTEKWIRIADLIAIGCLLLSIFIPIVIRN